MNKTITAECHNCESSYDIEYVEELTSADYPEFCPFCGELIEEIAEYDEDDEDSDNQEWREGGSQLHHRL